MTVSSLVTKNFWIFSTATTIGLGSFLVTQQGNLVPSKNYELGTRPSVGYSWEEEFSNPYYEILGTERKTLYKAEIIYQFASNLINGSQDLDPAFAKSINDSFWDLV